MSIGKFVIVFEGGEAAGKTSQIGRIADALRRAKFDVLSTGVFRTPHGIFVRRWLMNIEQVSLASLRSQVFVLGSAMNQLVDEIESFKSGVVLVDRFVYSTMAYHGGGLSLGADVVKDIYAPVIARLAPNLVVFLDLPPEVIVARKAASDRVEAEPLDFHKRVREAFRSIFAELPQSVTVDARGSIDDVYAQLERIVLERVSVSIRPGGSS